MGFEDEWTAVTDGIDNIWENDEFIKGGVAASKGIDNWCGLDGEPVNGKWVS